MATTTETVTRQSQAGYKGFCRLLGFSTAGVVIGLLLMALFLL